ncbi:MAG: hypothetical protein WBD00_03980 [Candidatus Omnitrophota bacterium]|jgi:hypothetical protein
MFDLNKLGDMAKIADQAKKVQASQERSQRDQSDLLKKISGQLETIITLLKENR